MRDGYAGYKHLVDATYVWCGAHSLRDLKAIHDGDPEHQVGADAMANTLILALRETHTARSAGRDALDQAVLSQIRSRYQGAINPMRAENAADTTVLHGKALTLATRFEAEREAILRFAWDLAVPFSNNAAERDIRGTKVRQRVSGCWRTLAGLADFATIWSYLSTAAKHGVDRLDALTILFGDQGPWLPPTPA